MFYTQLIFISLLTITDVILMAVIVLQTIETLPGLVRMLLNGQNVNHHSTSIMVIVTRSMTSRTVTLMVTTVSTRKSGHYVPAIWPN